MRKKKKTVKKKSVKKNIKRTWVDIVKDHFLKTKYEIGINKCLNKVDFLTY